ncbi:MAG: response regulator transcription factor [Clostridiaceae bacterium]|nr:response regulator transcription factor [Clostridiaceae bacterium]
MQQKAKILVVDDEPGVVSLLKDYFEMNDYLVLTASDGEEAIKQAGHGPSIILLDINMPKMDGLEVCKRIREHINCLIIFLTARVEDMDKIAGFIAGGDDYVTKPFSIDELGARVMAHLRRENRRTGSTKVSFEGDLTIDYGAYKVSVGGQEVPLTKKEFEIIELLPKNRGQVFDKERVYERLWGNDAEGDSAVIAEHIKRIRAKLKSAGTGEHIETVWGVGYKWK